MKIPPKFADCIGKHRGEKALVVGCGPSVRDFPLDELYGWTGPTFGVNRCLYWFTPDYYFNIYALGNFMCSPSRGDKCMFHWTERMGRADEYGTGLLSMSTIGLAALTAAFQMGCSEIHLVGIDFTVSEGGSPYFYNQHGKGWYFKESKLGQHIKNFKFAFQVMGYDGVTVVQRNPDSLIQP